ncbi:MAG: diguanylate cyclase [Planctomycetia bacterium]|nr:MAG: diguanylate cyclase [Planctomycetia bacterium]
MTGQPNTAAEARVDESGPAKVERQVTDIATLLAALNEAASNSGQSYAAARSDHENRLVQVRLGLASSLFAALRAKHAPTAAHSLRVALGCSAWAVDMQLPDQACDTLELAGLLHDIGKIGVPDALLQKPGRLAPDEAAIMNRHLQEGEVILKHCCASTELLSTIRHVGAWYDGSKPGFDCSGSNIPVSARMLAIVCAFDAMTTDHVYRPARSVERALADLFRCAGTQFDPKLLGKFAAWQSRDPTPIFAKVAHRWLTTLQAETGHLPWRLASDRTSCGPDGTRDDLFEKQLLDGMRDGVVFIDSRRQIFLWNRGVERLTGTAQSTIVQHTWAPALLQLRHENGQPLVGKQDPVERAISEGMSWRQRVLIRGRNGRELPVELHVLPAHRHDGTCGGALLLLHDLSPEASLERRCQDLKDRATRDGLTGIANRAEFDRKLKGFVTAHLDSKSPYSLVVCDIDHFKKVNDEHGHQAGDQAIKALAALLRAHCHADDFVGRYGGEEFVLLFEDCDNASAAQRANQIRRELAQTTLPELNGGRITASFGVTELQPGDTPATMFRRADRALLQAKEMGRNLVVQLGTGMVIERHRRAAWWPSRRRAPGILVDTHLVTSLPIEVTVQKLRGFVADHDARITAVNEDQIDILLENNYPCGVSRRDSRPVPFLIQLQFTQSALDTTWARGSVVYTYIRVVIQPKRNRERRREEASQLVWQVSASLRSYLMAEEPTAAQKKAARKAERTKLPWFRKR